MIFFHFVTIKHEGYLYMQLTSCNEMSHLQYNNSLTLMHKNVWNVIYPQYSISQEICTRFLLCFVVVIHWLIFPYPSGLLHWHCCNLTIVPVPAKQPWWIWINTSCEFIMNDCITTTKQSTTKPCAYFLGYTVNQRVPSIVDCLYDRYIFSDESIVLAIY